MSEYSVNTLIFTVARRPTQAELVRAAVEELIGGDVTTWAGSAVFTNIAQFLPSAGRPSTVAQERRQLLAETPMAEALVRRAAGDALAQADDLLQASRRMLALGDPASADDLARQADGHVKSAVETTAALARVDERTLATEAAERALHALGYRVDLASGARSNGIWATRASTVMAVLVQDGGVMELDTAGNPGAACRPVVDEFLDQLADEGAVAEATRRVAHGDDRGGVLIARAGAAARADRDYAAGVVRQFEQGIAEAAATEPAFVASPRREALQ